MAATDLDFNKLLVRRRSQYQTARRAAALKARSGRGALASALWNFRIRCGRATVTRAGSCQRRLIIMPEQVLGPVIDRHAAGRSQRRLGKAAAEDSDRSNAGLSGGL